MRWNRVMLSVMTIPILDTRLVLRAQKRFCRQMKRIEHETQACAVKITSHHFSSESRPSRIFQKVKTRSCFRIFEGLRMMIDGQLQGVWVRIVS
jgi:hypothetical protein